MNMLSVRTSQNHCPLQVLRISAVHVRRVILVGHSHGNSMRMSRMFCTTVDFENMFLRALFKTNFCGRFSLAQNCD